MDRLEALQAIRHINKEEFEDKIKLQGLPKERQDLLFKVIQGEIQVGYSCKPDIEDYALKSLMPEVFKSLPHDGHPYSSCELYEYDPPKNGQNIIKHGIGFGEVVSYSSQFGTLLVPCPDDSDGERCVIFSDLNLELEGNELALPPSGIREVNYTLSIAHYRDGRFRFISSRLMSSRKEKYRKTMEQAFGEIIADALARQAFIDRCVEIVETDLIRTASPIRPPAPTESIHRGMPTSAEPMWHPATYPNRPKMIPQIQRLQIPRPTGGLSGACYDALIYQRGLPAADRGNQLGFLCFKTLDALERAAQHVSDIKSNYDKMLMLLSLATKGQLTEGQVTELREVYNRSFDTVFPTTQAFLNWSHQFLGLSQEHNLASISLPRLRHLEEASLVDASLGELLKELRMAFARIRGLNDSQGFRQAFEFYGEALVYSLLSAKFETRRIVAKSSSMPDFSCTLPNGKEFFVELKSFDIADGPYRSAQMHEDAMRQQIELENQRNRGAPIAVAVREVAPYKRAFGKPDEYDPASLLTVIDTFIDKARSAFKPKQFAQGPTFAFALCNRLLLPGGKHSVAPHYYERGASAIVSGVLWHACFGQAGWPISRIPNFEGKPGIEGYMSSNGLMSDPAVPFPSGALIFVDTTWQQDTVLGLYDARWISPSPSWTVEDTEEVMHTLCSAFNDAANSYGQLLALT